MKMNRVGAALACVAFSVALAGCDFQRSGSTTGTPSATPAGGAAAPKAGEPFKVALLTEGSIADGGWNASAFAGLKEIEKQLGATVLYAQASKPQDLEEGLRDFAKQGARLVFGHGFEFQDPAKKVGAEFPGTTFIVMSGVEPFANGAPIIFKIEEAMYLAGVAAAHASKAKKLACVGGEPIPPVVRGFKAFALGAKRVAKDASVRENVYLGGWGDPAKGREQARALAGDGVDVIIHNADRGGLGVFEAAKEKGILALGSNSDQTALAPEVVLGSATIDISGAMLDVAREVKDGTFKPSKRLVGMKEGRVGLALNEALAKTRLDETARKDLEAAKADLLAGKVVLE